MDREMDHMDSNGPCQNRLDEFRILRLVWGVYGEGSQDVHTLVTVLAESRVRSLALKGEAPGPHQLGLEVSIIRRRLSCAAIRAMNGCLLGRMSQVGDGSGMAAKRRAQQSAEEATMANLEESDRVARIMGQEIVQRGRFWKG